MAVKEELKIRGITEKQELKPSETWRDTRTLWEKTYQLFFDKNFCFLLLCGFVMFIFLFPIFAELLFLIGIFVFWRVSHLKIKLPFSYPESSGIVDYDNRDHEGKPKKADGIAFLGNERGSCKELWFSNSDMRTHLLLFGSTGAGKALRKEELVFTPYGLVKNKDLIVGSEIIKHDGEVGKVLAIYDQGVKNLYEIKFNDGRSIKVSKDHLWEVYEYIEDFNNVKYKKPEVIPTTQIFNKLKEIKSLKRTDENNIPCLGILPVENIDFVGKKIITEQKNNKIVHENILRFLQGKKHTSDLDDVLSGTLSQRKLFWYEYFHALKQQYDVVKSFINQEIILFYNEEFALLIQKLLWSLGYWCKLSPINELPVLKSDENYICGLSIQEKSFLKIDEVIITEEYEDCQCIKIDDERGLFVVENYIVTHNTEALISMAYNSLVQGSGFIYVDGKGDASLWGKILSMARSVGREDDVLVLNYMTGGRDVLGPQPTKLSNTLNPLTSGTSGGLTELIVGLMGSSGGGGDGDMWKGRAISLVSSVMRALVWKRDNEFFLLDVEKLRDYLILKKIYELSKSPTLPEKIKNSLHAYLTSLPGYNEQTPIDKQNETVSEQHGFLQMQFTRILSSLSDDYGHIFQVNLGEVDFNDVVINRRILCVLLPALEKSPEELSNLGKIVVGCIKAMMSKGLGDSLEGSYKDIIDTRPTNSPSPYMCILDEYGYYSVKGAAVMPAQARSLGFCMIFAGQDYPAFKKNGNAEEAGSIISNLNIKIFMKLEDPTDTYKLFVDSVGEASVQKLRNKDRDTGLFGNSYRDSDKLEIMKEKRGDLLDLKDQKNGEAHILFKSQIIRARLFYANPKLMDYLQLNYFIKVEPPSEIDKEKFRLNEENAINIINNNFNIDQILSSHDEKSIRFNKPKLWKNINNIFRDKGLSKTNARKALFSSLFTLEHHVYSLPISNYDVYDMETVDKISTYNYEEIDPDYENKIKHIESRFSPENEKLNEKVKQTIKDMENVAEYPKEGVPTPEVQETEEIKENIEAFLEKID